MTTLFTKTCLLTSVAILYACASTPPSGGSQTAGVETSEDAEDAETSEDAEDAETSENSGEASTSQACASAFDQGAADRTCNATYRGQCFETNEEACACAGCPIDRADCLIAESDPTQGRCGG
jgi:hypothetical protein